MRETHQIVLKEIQVSSLVQRRNYSIVIVPVSASFFVRPYFILLFNFFHLFPSLFFLFSFLFLPLFLRFLFLSILLPFQFISFSLLHINQIQNTKNTTFFSRSASR